MRVREWLPTVVVVALAVIGPQLDDQCGSTDGPQFQCWLDEQQAERSLLGVYHP